MTPFTPRGLALVWLALATAATPAIGKEFPEGTWAISNPEGEVTNVFEFNGDGSVVSQVDGTSGESFQLKDGRVLLVLEDAVIVGTLAELEKQYALEGSIYATPQPIALQLTQSTPNKLKQAKKTQDELAKLIEQSQAQQLQQLIQQNLAAIASAFQIHMLIEGSTEVRFEDVVGEGKYLPQIIKYRGERYEALSARAETRVLSVTDADGNEYSYQF